MKTPTIAAKYDMLLAMVMPPGASEIQKREAKRMFYAGASAALTIFTEVIADPATSEDAGVAMISALLQECDAFSAQIAAGRA